MFKNVKTSHGIAILGACLLAAIVIINSANQGFNNGLGQLSKLTSLANPRSQMAAVSGSGSGLVGYWAFDEGSGTTAADSSGNGNNGTLVGNPSWTTGIVGIGALSFNGSGGVSIGNNVVDTGDATICAWVFPTASGYQFIAGNGKAELFENAGSGLFYYRSDGGSNVSSGSGAAAQNIWQHVCATRTSSGMANIYVNGSLSGSADQNSGTPTTGTGSFYIGEQNNGNFPFSGSIDDVRVYNRVLSSNEIGQLYALGSGGGNNGANNNGNTGNAGSNAGNQTTYSLSVTNSGNGTITSNPSGISCGSTCSISNIAGGTPYTLTATPNTNYTTAWSGCTSSNGNTCTVTVNSNISVTATFYQNQVTPTPTPQQSGNIITAASCSSADVQSALNLVSVENTVVNIPAGTCSWTAPVIYNQVYSTTIKGAGAQTPSGGTDQTVIIDDVNHDIINQGGSFGITTATGKAFRMTGMAFYDDPNNTTIHWNGMIGIDGNSQSIRIDHDHFKFTRAGISIEGWIYGVIDHNLFDAPVGSIGFMRFGEPFWNGDPTGEGNASWADGSHFGSNKFIFAEDNTFNGGYAEDCYDGGRFVLRYNILNGTNLQTHGLTAGARPGCRAMEVYGNTTTYSNDPTNINFPFVIMLESGTGMFWGNKITGYLSFIYEDTVRTNKLTYGQTAPPNGWGYCGTALGPSPWDGNTDSTGYPCMEQVGRGKGDMLTGTNFPNIVDSVTGTIAWPHQELDPVYVWDNIYNPVPQESGDTLWASVSWASVNRAVMENRDYYLQLPNYSEPTKNFDGTAGVGQGLLSARPSTCVPAVAYWATDTNTLYQCSSVNTWSAYYTPFPYPYPLDANGFPVASGGITYNPSPLPSPINGLCSITLNQCGAGIASGISTASSNHLWSCIGSSGGTTASCSLAIAASSTTPSNGGTSGVGGTTGGGGGGGYSPTVQTPTISNITTTPAGLTSITIAWFTSLPATSQVLYGLTSVYGSQTGLVSALTTSHVVTLTNLQPNTVYHFKLLSTASGVSAPTNDLTLTTSKASTYTPVITSPTIPAGNTTISTIPASLLNIQYGTRSSSVVSLQNQLISLGFLASGLNTGYYGPLTQAAITKYKSSATNQQTTTNTQSPSSQLKTPNSSTFTRTLTLGSTGSDVQQLQTFLNNHGFIVASTGPGSKGNETTYYGPATAAAISRFQLAHYSTILAPNGLTQGTGTFGPSTMKVVNQLK